MTAALNIANLYLDADNKDRLIESKEVVVKAIDAITLLGRAPKQITFERKERLRSALSEDYRSICDQDHPSSKLLFFKLPRQKEKLLESKPTSQTKRQEHVFRSSTETELTNVKALKSKLTKKVNKFTSGSIGRHIASWEALTNDKDILSTVSGMPIEFGDENFSLEGSTFEMKFSPKVKNFLNEEIEKLLKKELINESSHETGEFISPIFLVPKSPTSYRLILNLKKLNEHLSYINFKMETIHSILTMITPNCCMAKLDIQDAYYSIPILEEHLQYLKFLFGQKFYQFTCLPKGLCSGPRKFTKLLKAPFAYLHKRLINMPAYIDDLFTCSPS